jgi:hypothetical protein
MWIGLSSFFWGCGRNEDSSLDQVATQEPLLRFAEVQDERVQEPQSYLVAFRQLLDNPRDHFTAYPARLRTHMQALMRNFSRDLGPAPSRYLGSLNLADLSQSFVPKQSMGPMLLRQGPQDSALDGMASLVEVNFANDQQARATLRKWLDEGRIYYAEPNGKSEMKGALEDEIVERFRDNQQLTPWLEQIAFLPAIQQMGQLTSIEDPPVIAVMDSGVDVMHPNLRPAIYVNESGQNKLCKNDIFGCNTTVARKENLGDGKVYPAGTSDFGQSCGEEGQCQHGTHVAGIIAARDADDYVGMCPYCQILVVKVVDLENAGDNQTSFVIKDASIIAGLAYISGFKKKGEPLVRVINASFGKFERSRSVELFIKSLKSFGRGTLMVAAAGNEDTMRRQYPAGFDSVIAVSNVNSEVTDPYKSPSSNYGTWVDIAAPGDGVCADGPGIRSSVPGGFARCKVGTSMSAPIVAGIAGLLLSKEPTLTAEQVERRLLDSAEPDKLYSDSVNNGYRPSIQGMGLVPLLGSGVVNANLALDPNQDLSPPVTTRRSDLVRAGCGVVGGEGAYLWSWFWLALPLLVFGWRRWRN